MCSRSLVGGAGFFSAIWEHLGPAFTECKAVALTSFSLSLTYYISLPSCCVLTLLQLQELYTPLHPTTLILLIPTPHLV